MCMGNAILRCTGPAALGAALALTLTIASEGFARETPKVVGGDPVEIGQFPFLVLVSDDESLCTGSLIADRWVLTAAHCEEPTDVMIGDSESGVLGPGHVVESLAVEQWIPHPGWNPVTFANDVALIRLAGDATQHPPRLDGDVLYVPSPIGLASTPAQAASSIGNVTIAGFGETDEGDVPEVAYWASGIPTFPASVCDDVYDGVSGTTQLCFGIYPSICDGDSGGAVFKSGGAGFVQYGIVSFGAADVACGEIESVATYVPAFRTWIESRIGGVTPANPIQLGWELPPAAAAGVATGIANAQGWAFSSAGSITSIRLLRNGQPFLTLPCCSERGDVQATVPGAPPLSGFSAAANWGLIPGTQSLTLVVRDSAGNEVREDRTITAVRPLARAAFARDLTWGSATSCAPFTDASGKAGIACDGFSFQQGACVGSLELLWSDGKQTFEVVDGCS
jgi:secreted trypsin-like serine protease